MTKAVTDLLRDASEYCSKRAKDVNWGNYKAIATHEIELLHDSILEVGRSPTRELLDGSINKLSTVLHNAANTCIVQENTRNHGTSTEVVNLPFNDLLKESDRALSKYLTGAAGADEWHTAKPIALKENKKVHFGKIVKHWASLISTQDSEQIWEAINWKGDAAGDAALPKTKSSDDLARHFLTKGDDHSPLDVSCIHTNQYVEAFDKPVSIEEVYESANRLKEKSTCDGWCPQMIKSIHPLCIPL